jgi:hypothetical protein
MAADVRIDIAAQFVGKKAFKEAETSTDKLTKNVKGLAKGLLAVIAHRRFCLMQRLLLRLSQKMTKQLRH